MKRLVALTLAIAACLSLAACGSKTGDTAASTTAASTTAGAETSAAEIPAASEDIAADTIKITDVTVQENENLSDCMDIIFNYESGNKFHIAEDETSVKLNGNSIDLRGRSAGHGIFAVKVEKEELKAIGIDDASDIQSIEMRINPVGADWKATGDAFDIIITRGSADGSEWLLSTAETEAVSSSASESEPGTYNMKTAVENGYIDTVYTLNGDGTYQKETTYPATGKTNSADGSWTESDGMLVLNDVIYWGGIGDNYVIMIGRTDADSPVSAQMTEHSSADMAEFEDSFINPVTGQTGTTTYSLDLKNNTFTIDGEKYTAEITEVADGIYRVITEEDVYAADINAGLLHSGAYITDYPLEVYDYSKFLAAVNAAVQAEENAKAAAEAEKAAKEANADYEFGAKIVNYMKSGDYEAITALYKASPEEFTASAESFLSAGGYAYHYMVKASQGDDRYAAVCLDFDSDITIIWCTNENCLNGGDYGNCVYGDEAYVMFDKEGNLRSYLKDGKGYSQDGTSWDADPAEIVFVCHMG